MPTWLLLAVITSAAVVGVSVSVYVIATQPDFALITASDPMMLINATSQGSRAIDVQPVNGYSGIVTLTMSSPAGFKGRLFISTPTGSGPPPQVQVLLGPEENVTLGVDSYLTGNYSVIVTGVSGRLSHSITVNFIVRGFFISGNPNPAPLPPSGSYTTTSEVSVTTLNGLSGNFTLGYVNGNSAFYPLSGTGPAYVVVGLGQTVKFNVTINTQSSPYGGGLYVTIGTSLGATRYLLTVR